jgi:hypothetical protein
MCFKPTVKINFTIIDCKVKSPNTSNNYYIRYSVVMPDGAMTTPKKKIIIEYNPAYALIKECFPTGVDYTEFKKLTEDFYASCSCGC